MERLWFQVINRDGTAQTMKDKDGNVIPITVGASSEAEVEEFRKKGWRELPVASRAQETKAPEGDGGEKTQSPEGDTNITTAGEGEDSALDGAGDGQPEASDDDAAGAPEVAPASQSGLLDDAAPPASVKNVTASRRGSNKR